MSVKGVASLAGRYGFRDDFVTPTTGGTSNLASWETASYEAGR
jgi:hypothetical protein